MFLQHFFNRHSVGPTSVKIFGDPLGGKQVFEIV